MNAQAHATHDQWTNLPGQPFHQSSDPSSNKCSNIQGALSRPEAGTANLSPLQPPALSPFPLPIPLMGLPPPTPPQGRTPGNLQDIPRKSPGALNSPQALSTDWIHASTSPGESEHQGPPTLEAPPAVAYFSSHTNDITSTGACCAPQAWLTHRTRPSPGPHQALTQGPGTAPPGLALRQ